MLAENAQSWISEWLAEERDIDLQKTRKKIADFRFQLQNDNFWAEIDKR